MFSIKKKQNQQKKQPKKTTIMFAFWGNNQDQDNFVIKNRKKYLSIEFDYPQSKEECS